MGERIASGSNVDLKMLRSAMETKMHNRSLGVMVNIDFNSTSIKAFLTGKILVGWKNHTIKILKFNLKGRNTVSIM